MCTIVVLSSIIIFLLFIISVLWSQPEPCRHVFMERRFKELHRGGDDELYVIAKEHCRHCNYKGSSAICLPHVISDLIDENLWAGTLRPRTEDEKALYFKQMADYKERKNV